MASKQKHNAIKEKLIPLAVTKEQSAFIYATEADVLNVALFGNTAKQWRECNPDKQGNIRDEATLEQLVVLSNLESINALLLHQGLPQTMGFVASVVLGPIGYFGVRLCTHSEPFRYQAKRGLCAWTCVVTGCCIALLCAAVKDTSGDLLSLYLNSLSQ